MTNFRQPKIDAELLSARALSESVPIPDSVRKTPGHYQTETLRPLVSLIYVLPFLLVYELGVIFLEGRSIRNGLDVWLESLLSVIGVGELLLLPLITIFTLIALHHLREDHWSVRPTVFLGMLIESFGIATIVLCAAKAQQLLLLQYSEPIPLLAIFVAATGEPSTLATSGVWANVVSFCGAGLYEELVFRLLLLPATMLLLMRLGMSKVVAGAIAIAFVSMLFAGAHYDFLNPAGNPFEWPGFAARMVVGIFFSLVFLFRGFGVAVGTHTAYDILTLL